uniref:Calcineurin-like phosphoesterase domain-containing protein n=1 Tax=Panagrolaimus sp. ES5 TaxID=591445 RepID=A0AC34G2G3_9BILA
MSLNWKLVYPTKLIEHLTKPTISSEEASTLLDLSSSPEAALPPSKKISEFTLEEDEVSDIRYTKNPSFRLRLLNTLEYVHQKLFAGMPKRLILILIFVDICFLVARFSFEHYGSPHLARAFLILFIELAMTIGSCFIYKRIVSIPSKNNKNHQSTWPKSARTALKIFAFTWILLAHACWIFFYLPLPEDLFFAVLCFLAIGAYIHCAVFIFTFFFIERFAHLLVPLSRNPLLISETLHTSIAVILALLLTVQGFISTYRPPIVKNLNVFIRDLPHELDGFSVALITALLLTVQGFISTYRPPIVKNLNVFIRDLPYELDGFSVALITDIHIGPSVGKSRVAEIVEVINGIQPDVVGIAGDLVDGYVDYLRPRAKPLADIRSRFGAFVALGNHEFFHEKADNWIKFFKDELNLTTLVNSAVILEKGGKQLCFSAVNDLYTETINVEGHTLDPVKALENCPQNATTIVMSHQPNGAARILSSIENTNKRVDLILSGHTHAGQMFVVYPL